MPEAPALLALETATDVCSVALLRGERVVVELTLARPRRHAEQLAPLIRDALRYGDTAPADLEAVAVSQGPGSYTGLRIGVSTAKGLARATGAALVGVPTLEALAASAAGCARPGEVLLPLLDARRDEVYAAAFRRAEDHDLTPLADTTALPVGELAGWLRAAGLDPSELDPSEASGYLLGSGTGKAQEPLRESDLRLTVLSPAQHPPSAAWVGRRALGRLQAGTVADAASFEPYYLKAFT